MTLVIAFKMLILLELFLSEFDNLITYGLLMSYVYRVHTDSYPA